MGVVAMLAVPLVNLCAICSPTDLGVWVLGQKVSKQVEKTDFGIAEG
jgi:hypothetical protein